MNQFNAILKCIRASGCLINVPCSVCWLMATSPPTSIAERDCRWGYRRGFLISSRRSKEQCEFSLSRVEETGTNSPCRQRTCAYFKLQPTHSLRGRETFLKCAAFIKFSQDVKHACWLTYHLGHCHRVSQSHRLRAHVPRSKSHANTLCNMLEITGEISCAIEIGK
jgi:hypothetical protein